MRWNTPEMVEVKMDAEIGSYQADDEERDPLFVRPSLPSDESDRVSE